MSKDSSNPHVVIIGGGLGGISTAIALKNKLKFTNFTIYEKAAGVGGTWRDNTYPGCACDTPSHWYSLSSELNPNWSIKWSPQPEILQYWTDIVKKHDLISHFQFHRKVEVCEWDSKLRLYRIVVRHMDSNLLSETTARIVISAVGDLVDPQYPADIAGIEDFKGDVWHSAQWNHKVELSGKKVGVVGNGCSAIQFIPQIASDPSVNVVNFCRTPNWFVPKDQSKYSSLTRWAFKHIPLLLKTYRAVVMAKADVAYILWPKWSAWIRSAVKKDMIKYIKKMAPEKYHEQLIPKYPPGCKRLALDSGYLQCLGQPNVDLNWDGIDKVVERGIVTKSGEIIDLDVIIFGTGFTILKHTFELRGNKGQTIDEYWDSIGGPEAYLGTSIPGFPNFYTLFGPNVGTGHASAIFTEEAQINYIMRLIQPIVTGRIVSLEVKADASNAYNKELQTRLRKTIWMDCRSWYRAGNQDGKITVVYPGMATKFWWNTLAPRWQDYNADILKNWTPPGRASSLLKAIFVM